MIQRTYKQSIENCYLFDFFSIKKTNNGLQISKGEFFFLKNF